MFRLLRNRSPEMALLSMKEMQMRSCLYIRKSCMILAWVTEAFLVSDWRQDLPHVAVAALRAVPARMLTSTCVTHGSYPYYSLIYAVLWENPYFQVLWCKFIMSPHISIEKKSWHYNLKKNRVLCPWSNNRMARVYKLLFGKVCCVKD